MEKISMNSLMDSAILTSNDLQNTVGGYLYPQDGGGGSFSLSDLPDHKQLRIMVMLINTGSPVRIGHKLVFGLDS